MIDPRDDDTPPPAESNEAAAPAEDARPAPVDDAARVEAAAPAEDAAPAGDATPPGEPAPTAGDAAPSGEPAPGDGAAAGDAAPAGDSPKTGDRIAKVMSRAGVASRREAERMVIEGRVTVNGRVIDSPALDVTPADRIIVDGKPLEAPQETRLWLYYKPVGIVTTDSDEKGRQTIQDALPRDLPRVMTVGRLDLNSEGLLLLTNDGALKRVLELPSTGWLRRYRVRVNGTPNDLTMAPLKRGITIEGEEFAPMEVTIDSSRGANSWLTVGIREGRNREIRRAMAHVGLTVNRLIRIGYGPFKLADMEKNEVREVKRRIMREQLGGLLPDADRDEGQAAPSHRRTATHRPAAGAPRGERARAGGFARREAGEKAAYPARTRAQGERSARPEGPAQGSGGPARGTGSKPFRRREEGTERPARPPHHAEGGRPTRKWGDGEGARDKWKERSDRSPPGRGDDAQPARQVRGRGTGDDAYRDRTPRAAPFDRAARPRNQAPRPPEGEGMGGARPKASRTGRFDRPDRAHGDKPRPARPPRDDVAAGPRKGPYQKRPPRDGDAPGAAGGAGARTGARMGGASSRPRNFEKGKGAPHTGGRPSGGKSRSPNGHGDRAPRGPGGKPRGR